jgi:hypothetical protein
MVMRLPKNHPKLNQCMFWLLVTVRANVDAQMNLDHASSMKYILKYTTKAEKQTSAFKEVAKQVITQAAKPGSVVAQTTGSVLTKILNLTFGERDWADVEVFHINLGLPLTETSVNTQTFSFSEVKALQHDHTEDEGKVKDSNLTWYAKRPENLCGLTPYQLVFRFTTTSV